MDKPSATITGLDDLLVNISGKFNKGMDDYFFGKNSVFIKEMDKAAAKVFQAMATGATLNGHRAYPAMGVYHSLPAFLKPFTEEWEPLGKEYLKRKKRLMQNHTGKSAKSSKERIKTTAYWEYKGTLKRYFQHHSPTLTAKSNNLMEKRATVATVGYDEHIFSDVVKNQNARFSMTAGLNNKGMSRFDFTYNPTGNGRPIGATYGKGHAKSGMPVTSQSLSSIKRHVQFDLFRGLRQHLLAIEGKAPPPSPEDYIAGIQTSSADGKRMQQIKGTGQYMNSDMKVFEKGSFKDTSIGIKLSYQKNGVTKYRGLITPYMRYYAKRVLEPMAKKLIKQGF